MSPPPDSTAPNTAAAVRAILEEARRAAGGGPLFAEKLGQMGVGPPEGYSESAISNWIRGRTMPPADVLLAAAAMSGISVDERLLAGPAATSPETRPSDPDIVRIQAELDELRAHVIELYTRLGYQLPHERRPEKRTPRSAAG